MGIVKNLFLRIVLRIIGVCSFLSGVVLLIGALGAFLDGDTGLAIFGMVLGIGLVAGGIALFLLTRKSDVDEASSDDNIVEIRSETLVPLNVGRKESTATPSGSRSASSSFTPLESMLIRSNDVVATLKDLVRHESNTSSDTLDIVIADTLLSNTKLLEWNPPTIHARILSRTNAFWLNSDDELAPADQESLVGYEMVLNLARNIGKDESGAMQGTVSMSLEEAQAKAQENLFASMERDFPSWDPNSDVELVYPDPALRISSGEWVARLSIIRFLEDASFPMRVVYSVDTNVRKRICMLGLVVPSPRAFSAIAATDAQAANLARSWALRLAVQAASKAFGSTIDRVCINMRDYTQKDDILSFDLNHESLERLKAFCASYAPCEGLLPSDISCRFSIREDGWLNPIQPLYNPVAEELSDPTRFAPVELSESPAAPALASFFRISRVSELGINENAARTKALSALNEVLDSGSASTESLVSALVGIKDSSGNDTDLAQATERTSKALVDGILDISNPDEIRTTFVAGSELEVANRRAMDLIDSDQDLHEQPPHLLEEAVSLMEAALEPIDSQGSYEDGEDYEWRFFGSTAERVLYNREFHDAAREVRLVPDAYHFAHLSCARMLTILGRLEDAEKHELVLDRISPLSINAGLQHVRTLEYMTRIYEAAEMLNHLVDISCTVEDAAICLYRMAYMQWKLGRSDLAVACYTRCNHWPHEMFLKAEEELSTLIENESELELMSDEEAEKALKDAGINLGLTEERRRMLFDGAVIACDSNLFSIASPLLASVYGISRNDAILAAYRSLEPFS